MKGMCRKSRALSRVNWFLIGIILAALVFTVGPAQALEEDQTGVIKVYRVELPVVEEDKPIYIFQRPDRKRLVVLYSDVSKPYSQQLHDAINKKLYGFLDEKDKAGNRIGCNYKEFYRNLSGEKDPCGPNCWEKIKGELEEKDSVPFCGVILKVDSVDFNSWLNDKPEALERYELTPEVVNNRFKVGFGNSDRVEEGLKKALDDYQIETTSNKGTPLDSWDYIQRNKQRADSGKVKPKEKKPPATAPSSPPPTTAETVTSVPPTSPTTTGPPETATQTVEADGKYGLSGWFNDGWEYVKTKWWWFIIGLGVLVAVCFWILKEYIRSRRDRDPDEPAVETPTRADLADLRADLNSGLNALSGRIAARLDQAEAKLAGLADSNQAAARAEAATADLGTRLGDNLGLLGTDLGDLKGDTRSIADQVGDVAKTMGSLSGVVDKASQVTESTQRTASDLNQKLDLLTASNEELAAIRDQSQQQLEAYEKLKESFGSLGASFREISGKIRESQQEGLEEAASRLANLEYLSGRDAGIMKHALVQYLEDILSAVGLVSEKAERALDQSLETGKTTSDSLQDITQLLVRTNHLWRQDNEGLEQAKEGIAEKVRELEEREAELAATRADLSATTEDRDTSIRTSYSLLNRLHLPPEVLPEDLEMSEEGRNRIMGVARSVGNQQTIVTNYQKTLGEINKMLRVCRNHAAAAPKEFRSLWSAVDLEDLTEQIGLTHSKSNPDELERVLQEVINDHNLDGPNREVDALRVMILETDHWERMGALLRSAAFAKAYLRPYSDPNVREISSQLEFCEFELRTFLMKNFRVYPHPLMFLVSKRDPDQQDSFMDLSNKRLNPRLEGNPKMLEWLIKFWEDQNQKQNGTLDNAVYDVEHWGYEHSSHSMPSIVWSLNQEEAHRIREYIKDR